MNRTIKFRAKRKGAPHEWLIGDLAHIEDKVYIFDRGNNAPLNSPDWYEVIHETVGQFIGLADNNGKEIYEGDIAILTRHSSLPHADNKPRIGIIEYAKHMASFIFKYTDGERARRFANFSATIGFEDETRDERFEIIGNIHDNRELLK